MIRQNSCSFLQFNQHHLLKYVIDLHLDEITIECVMCEKIVGRDAVIGGSDQTIVADEHYVSEPIICLFSVFTGDVYQYNEVLHYFFQVTLSTVAPVSWTLSSLSRIVWSTFWLYSWRSFPWPWCYKRPLGGLSELLLF